MTSVDNYELEEAHFMQFKLILYKMKLILYQFKLIQCSFRAI